MITGMPRVALAVRDFPAAVETFREKLGMPVVDISSEAVPLLGARLAVCVPEGGSNIEIMSPATASAPLSQSLERFLERRGEGLFALMLEAPDPDEEAEALGDRGLEVLPLMPGAGGRDVHPRSTHGVLVRVYPVDSFVGRTGSGPTRADPDPGLSGIARVIVAVLDLDRAATVYGTRFGLAVERVRSDAERGVRSVLCEPPSGGTIELVAVEDGTRPFARSIAAHLDARGEGMFALILASRDLDATERALGARGVGVERSVWRPHQLELSADAFHGVHLHIASS